MIASSKPRIFLSSGDHLVSATFAGVLPVHLAAEDEPAEEHMTSEQIAPEDLNTYEGIAEFYDVLMNAGYYDYDEFSRALGEIFGARRRVMELGVGTGLVAERLLAHREDYQLVGVDNTEAMLAQARARMGERMKYALQDVTKLALEQRFEAAFSVGGCWYFIDLGDDIELCSHIDDLAASKQGLRKVVEHLEPGGVLAFALQGPHTDYSKPLTDELTYSQQVFPSEHGFTKRYVFETPDGVVAEQSYSYLVLSSDEAHAFFDELGCDPIGLDADRKFFTYQKRSSS